MPWYEQARDEEAKRIYNTPWKSDTYKYNKNTELQEEYKESKTMLMK